jgi:hypothetical protein
VQIIREQSSADVLLDGTAVMGYEVIGNFEVATVEIPSGSHEAASADPFSIVQVGYSDGTNSNWSSYAYPGGMKSEQLFVP